MYLRRLFQSLDLIRFDFSRDHSDMERTLHTSRYYPGNFYKRSLQLGKNLDVKIDSAYKFCVVRNPFSWYESYWRFMCDLDWKSMAPTNARTRFGFKYDQWHPLTSLEASADSDFNLFIHKVVTTQPGFLANLFSSYADEKHIDYVAKQETLETDIKNIFDHLGVKVSQKQLSFPGKVNTSQTSKPNWNAESRAQILISEKDVFLKYGYTG